MSKPLQAVVGDNARRIRQQAGVPQSAIVKASKELGATWSGGTVAALEAGTQRTTVESLIIAAGALSIATRNPVAIGDLLAGDDDVQVSPGVALPATSVLAFLAGAPLDDVPASASDVQEALDRAAELGSPDLDALRMSKQQAFKVYSKIGPPQHTEEEQRIARTMPGWDARMLHWASGAVWGRTFVEERDRRAGDAGNAQRKGRVTRELKAELIAWLDERKATWRPLSRTH